MHHVLGQAKPKMHHVLGLPKMKKQHVCTIPSYIYRNNSQCPMLAHFIWPDIGQANRPKAKTNHVFIWPDIGQANRPKAKTNHVQILTFVGLIVKDLSMNE